MLVLAGRNLPRPTARRLGVALAVYGSGGVVLEGINGWFHEHDLRALVVGGSTVEESLEIGACVLAVTALADHLHQHRPASPEQAPA